MYKNWNHSKYYKLCLADNPESNYPTCSLLHSVWDPIVTYFDPIINTIGRDITQADIDNFLSTYISTYGTMFYKSFHKSFATTNQSNFYRGIYKFGLPYPNINATYSTYRKLDPSEYIRHHRLSIQ